MPDSDHSDPTFRHYFVDEAGDPSLFNKHGKWTIKSKSLRTVITPTNCTIAALAASSKRGFTKTITIYGRFRDFSSEVKIDSFSSFGLKRA